MCSRCCCTDWRRKCCSAFGSKRFLVERQGGKGSPQDRLQVPNGQQVPSDIQERLIHAKDGCGDAGERVVGMAGNLAFSKKLINVRLPAVIESRMQSDARPPPSESPITNVGTSLGGSVTTSPPSFRATCPVGRPINSGTRKVGVVSADTIAPPRKARAAVFWSTQQSAKSSRAETKRNQGSEWTRYRPSPNVVSFPTCVHWPA